MRSSIRLFLLCSLTAGLACGPSFTPTAPSQLTAALSSSNAVHLSWHDLSDNETGFVIERGISSDVFLEIDVVGANEVGFDDFGLAPATYFYRVRAYNDVGTSAPCAVAQITVPPLSTVPLAPTDLAAVNVQAQDIALTWTDRSTNELGFKIERMMVMPSPLGLDANTWAAVTTTEANVTSFTDMELDPSITYAYRVASYDALGTSAWSNPAFATTQPIVIPVQVPAAPSELNGIATLDHQRLGWGLHLSWKDNSANETSFEVQRAITEGRWVFFAKTEANVNHLDLENLVAGAAGWYRVRAINTAGASPFSNVATVVLKPPLNAPAAPSNLAASVSFNAIDLRWTDNSNNETGFKIERAFDDGRWVEIATTKANVTNWVDKQRFPLQRRYRVRATNVFGDSLYSNAIWIGVKDLPMLPPEGD